MLPLKKNNWWPLCYEWKCFRFDLIAGLTAAAVVIPQAMAYAAIAGLPVETGLYTALVPMVVYAALGTSRTLSVSTTSTIAILTASELGMMAPGGTAGEMLVVASTLAVLTGLILLAASLLRLGFLANFISAPVLAGFKAGIGLVIAIDQIPKLLGIHFDKGAFFQNLGSILKHLPESHLSTLGLALATLVLIVGIKRLSPKWPAPLFAVVAGIVASALLGLQGKGIALVGAVPSGLPSFSWPEFSLVYKLWPGALGIALMAFTETIAAGRAFVRKGDPPLNANRELFALGVANIAGGFFHTLPAGGGTSQTAVNSRAGARTQMAELSTAASVIIVLLFLAPLIGLMPQATLAAIIIVTTGSLLNPADFQMIYQVRKTEFVWALVSLAGVVALGTLEGIGVAVAVSVFTLFYQANHPPVYALGRKKGTDVFRPLKDHPKDEVFPGLLIVRTEGRMTFASAPRTTDQFKDLIEKYSPQVVLLDLSAVPDIEYTALMMLTDAEERHRHNGVSLWLAALNPRALKMVEGSPLGERLGSKRMFFTVEQAVDAFLYYT